MSQVVSGPLPALIGYYRRLEGDTSQSVASYGFGREKIHFQIVLEKDGTLFAMEDIRLQNERGKPIPNMMTVPDGGGRSGTALKPFFCWDNTGYALGRDNKDKPKRAEEMFAAFREFHLSIREEIGEDAGYTALCRFLEKWNPEQAESLPNWEKDKAAGMNVVFRVRGQHGYVHESERVKQAWLRRMDAGQAEEITPRGASLISGQEQNLARLHPLISGVAGTNTTGAAIVSFNLDAFTSYGKSQSFNAPLSVHEAFQYTTALNRLLSDDNHRVRIGDATVVFWTDRPDGKESEEVFAALFSEEIPKEESAESGKLIDRLRGFLEAARLGKLGDRIKDPEAPFYVLGLSPNSSRINVRFWLCGTVKQFAERLAEHAAGLEIVGDPKNGSPPAIRTILLETAREPKDIPPQLAGELSRAVLQGLPYPEAMLNAIIRRIRADGVVSWRRAAILKAYLNREQRRMLRMEVYLNKAHPAKPYQCGRLLAVLAFAQEQALGTVNSGVIRRNLGSVMASPGLMLGRLQRNAETGHIPKLERDLPIFVRDEIKSINVMLKDDIPVHLTLRDQGIFALGFYQELQFLDFVGKQVEQGRRVRSSQGDWVRSRLEARVADALTKMGLTYIYESSAVLPNAGERWPDFVIRGKDRLGDLYIEVLGVDSPEYEKRWQEKLDAYGELGITPEGGPQGRLVILDFRKNQYDDRRVFDAIAPLVSLDNDPEHNGKETDNE